MCGEDGCWGVAHSASLQKQLALARATLGIPVFRTRDASHVPARLQPARRDAGEGDQAGRSGNPDTGSSPAADVEIATEEGRRSRGQVLCCVRACADIGPSAPS